MSIKALQTDKIAGYVANFAAERALRLTRDSMLNWKSIVIAGGTGLIGSILFILNITGPDHFLPFAKFVVGIGFISAFSGALLKTSNYWTPVLTGIIVSIACCLAVLLYAVSNI